MSDLTSDDFKAQKLELRARITKLLEDEPTDEQEAELRGIAKKSADLDAQYRKQNGIAPPPAVRPL
jgi:hypothetical protein